MANIFLVILIIAAAIAALVMLIRGIMAFLKTTEEDLNSGEAGPSASSLKQNKMMSARIMFQAIAILLVAILLLVRGSGH
ncbi:MAG: twin transmembrane helix small protein [Sphingobium sp.]